MMAWIHTYNSPYKYLIPVFRFYVPGTCNPTPDVSTSRVRAQKNKKRYDMCDSPVGYSTVRYSSSDSTLLYRYSLPG